MEILLRPIRNADEWRRIGARGSTAGLSATILRIGGQTILETSSAWPLKNVPRHLSTFGRLMEAAVAMAVEAGTEEEEEEELSRDA
jgi:hypothetical protein